jgi:hypothetical protein
MQTTKRILVVALAVAMVACGGTKKKTDTGGFSVTVAAATGVAQAVWIRVQGIGVDRTIPATSPDASNRTFTATFNLLPPGTYSVHGWGYDPADPVQVPPAPATYETRSVPDQTFVVTAGNTTTAHIVLQEVNPPAGLQNAPVINFISASAFSVEMASTTAVTLTARVTDVDGNLNGFAWSDGSDPLAVPPIANGTFSTDTGSLAGADQLITTTWTPSPTFQGPVTISLQVVDSTNNASTIAILLNVLPPSATTGTLVVVADINSVPIVDTSANLFVADGQIEPTAGVVPAPLASQTAVSIFAYDPDPQDVLTFAYSSSCGGSFSPASESSVTGGFTATNMFQSITTFTAPDVAPAGNFCTLTVAITDGRGSSVQQSVVIFVGPPTVAYAPEFTTNTAAVPVTSTFFPARPGDIVAFNAEAYQYVNAVQTFLPTAAFTWTFGYPIADGALTNVSAPGALSSTVQWTIPAAPSLCAGLPPASPVFYTASVQAAGFSPNPAVILDSTRAISVEVICP